MLQDKEYQYHTPLYQALLEQVVPLRTQFRLEKDVSAKKQMAKQEFDAWHNYLQTRKHHIANLEDQQQQEAQFSEAGHLYKHTIPNHTLKTLKEFLDRFKVSTPIAFMCVGPPNPSSALLLTG